MPTSCRVSDCNRQRASYSDLCWVCLNQTHKWIFQTPDPKTPVDPNYKQPPLKVGKRKVYEDIERYKRDFT